MRSERTLDVGSSGRSRPCTSGVLTLKRGDNPALGRVERRPPAVIVVAEVEHVGSAPLRWAWPWRP